MGWPNQLLGNDYNNSPGRINQQLSEGVSPPLTAVIAASWPTVDFLPTSGSNMIKFST
jgi:hypothetical protein